MVSNKPNWSEANDRAAKREGWAVFEVSGGRYDGRMRIQRLDDPRSIDESFPVEPVFVSDAAAITFVRRKAETGSNLHKAALALHSKP